MRRTIGPCLSVAVWLVMAIGSFAAVPRLINFQGVLTDAGGNPVRNDSVSVTFRIYDAASGGGMLWEETQGIKTDRNGSFNVVLGSVVPIPDAAFADSARWLGMTVGSDPEMNPLTRLASVPFSFRVNSVDGSMGGTITTGLAVDGEVHSTTAGYRFPDSTVQTTAATSGGWVDDGAVVRLQDSTDHVGIGTSNPQRDLDVVGQLRVSTGHFVSPSYFATITDAGDALPAKVGALAITDTYSTDPPALGLYVEGDIGVGTTSPTERVEVQGVVYSTSGGFKFPDGTTQTTAASPVGTILDYGSSPNSGTPVSMSQLKICYGKVQLTSSVLNISGLPFTSASTYTVVVTRDLTDYVSQAICTNKLSGSAFEIRDFTVNRYANWFAIGY